ncbi:aromatic acid exporter family protein [Streptomyces sp. NPDC001904]|uniref:FUSC family protein n=1 Tax=Streptomyces sp. NPDC001904 TaxID=3154531 RepID=UPI003324AF0C
MTASRTVAEEPAAADALLVQEAAPSLRPVPEAGRRAGRAVIRRWIPCPPPGAAEAFGEPARLLGSPVRHVSGVVQQPQHDRSMICAIGCCRNHVSVCSNLLGLPVVSKSLTEGPSSERKSGRVVDWFRRGQAWLQRAWNASGHERNTILLIGKCVLASTLSWWIAHDLLNATSPAFAPFSAVLTMNVTVSKSVWQTLRYIAAVVVGVAVQAAIGFTAGPDLFAFALVAVIALSLGQWQALGEQRSQVATAAFFAFSTYAAAATNSDRVAQLGQIIVLVLIGCGIGMVVNLSIAPPLRYRSAEQGLHALAGEMVSLLDDMANGLCSGDVDADRADRWVASGERVQAAVRQARAGLEMAESSVSLNPRRFLPAHRSYLTFTRYRQSLSAMERAVYQLASLTRSLGRWRDSENTYTYGPALTAYADFAGSLRDIAQVIAELDSDTLADQADEMCKLAATAQKALQKVLDAADKSQLPLADASRPYGVLIVEATRLMEEFQNTCDVLKDTAEM